MALIVDQRIEEERRQIAHELHDEFGQSVTAIRSCAQAIVQQSSEAGMRDAAQLISDEAARLYDAMHGLIPRLLPVALDPMDLVSTLEGLVNDWQKRYPQVQLALQQQVQAQLGPSVSLAACRVVQEGLINALRHAQAGRIEIRVEAAAEQLSVSVTDDGVGLPADWARAGNFGLRGLAGRIDHLGGTFSVCNHAPRGVRLVAQIPLVAELQGAA
jgi:two-component system sensor histidine kinase UhpB